ncbi:3-keto-5-aminohexanoate cleavage protein [Rhodococcus artemisiae]|uniref:3-keto-5-aminohexanoate cleavage protein n=1 Tax=Rhodococcus artemisiae TaxID=714159 RepID=A0ABU7LCV6_9NOCA|nr:3-keto-5-aminohexanoate cleavage protein [Rhodococcus artemisiae]MEE2059144.1 3-keto-5-aminohexanoate cleavage protein [Rhodococcus artemisiae]
MAKNEHPNVSERPAVIESAISPFRRGEPLKSLAATAFDAVECLTAGASIIHHHHDFRLDVSGTVDEMTDLGRRIHNEHPAAILYPDFVRGGSFAEKISHFGPLTANGTVNMIPVDPGAIMFGGVDEKGLPFTANRFGTDLTDACTLVDLASRAGVPVTIGVYEPGNLRFALACAATGRLPAGSMVKLYFAGEYSIYDIGQRALNFGLPPSKASLDAYLGMLEGSGLPWNVGVMGGVLLETPLARYALECGGHLRIGTEDAAGLSDADDREMVVAAVSLVESVGRPLARSERARDALLTADQAR